MQSLLNDKAHTSAEAALSGRFLHDQLASMGVGPGSRLALAVSGGADSMCLAHLASDHENSAALVVDHGLRAGSANEAQTVKARLEKIGLECHVLTWPHGGAPTSNIQSTAREARYDLMQKWCAERKIPYLLTAHHRDDQAETVILRLARGSGVYGLAGMAAIRDLGDGVKLLRPFLAVPKSRLVATCEQAGVPWVEDPSNQNRDFDRVRVRELLSSSVLSGLTTDRLAETAARLRRTRDAIEYYESEWLQQAATFHDAGYVRVETEAFSRAPEEITLRGLAQVIRFAGGGGYAPRFEKLERLWSALQKPDFKGATLGGAVFAPESAGSVLVVREPSAVCAAQEVDVSPIWDNRYKVHDVDAAVHHGIMIGAVGEDGLNLIETMMSGVPDIPKVAACVAPAFFKAGTLIAAPHLGYSDPNEKVPVLTHRWLTSSKTGKKTYRGVQ